MSHLDRYADLHAAFVAMDDRELEVACRAFGAQSLRSHDAGNQAMAEVWHQLSVTTGALAADARAALREADEAAEGEGPVVW